MDNLGENHFLTTNGLNVGLYSSFSLENYLFVGSFVSERPVDVLHQPEGSLVRAQTHLRKLFSVYWNLATRTSKKAHDYCWNVVFLCFVDPNLTLT